MKSGKKPITQKNGNDANDIIESVVLDDYEKQLEEEIERGEWIPVDDEEKQAITKSLQQAVKSNRCGWFGA